MLHQLQARFEQVSTQRRGRLLALRGRRQVGKSTLVTSFVENAAVPHLYFTGIKGAPPHAQLEAFTAAAHTARTPLAQTELIFSGAPAGWTEAFARVALAAAHGPVVIVLDEFPWAVEKSPSLEGELQIAWDQRLEKLPVLLVLVGSDVAMMERMTEHDRPLFGRAQPIVVPPLNPAEIADALPGAPALELFDAYLVTGGYPRLVRSCAAAGGGQRYVVGALADEHSDLVGTGRISLDAEFADAAAAYRVLSAIGGSEVASPRFTEVVAAISDPADRDAARTATTRALAALIHHKRLVEVVVPSGAASNSRLRRYRVTDPYLRFWFAFVERQIDNIGRGRADLAIDRFRASWSSWRGVSVEPVVQEALTRLGGWDPRLAGVAAVGSWWNRNHSVQVDVVARAQDVVGFLGTIKWRPRGGVTARERTELGRAREVVPGAGAAHLLAVCPSGAQAAAEFDEVFTAADLLRAWR